MLLLTLFSCIVATSAYIPNGSIGIRSKQQQQKRQRGVKTHRKDAIGESNAPNVFFFCCYCSSFGAVAVMMDNFVKINSTNNDLTQN